MTKRMTLLPLLLVAVLVACAPIGGSGESRQAEVERYAAELPWPVLDHARYVVHSTQDVGAYAYSDCPTHAVHVYPNAFTADLRWIVAHEAGHQRDCDGLPAEFYDLIAATNPAVGLYEAIANCLAESWLGYTDPDAWDCPDEIVTRVPEFAPN